MSSNPIKVILAIATLALGAGAAPAFVAASGDDGHGGKGGHGGGHGGDDDDHSTTDDDQTTTNEDSTTSTTTSTNPSPSGPGNGTGRVLIATVSDGRIALRRKGGGESGVLAPGKYTIRVSDTSSDHNFHLAGPGLNRKTTVDGRSAPTWSVSLRRGGTYTFVCDPHAAFMKGSVRVRA